jgi:hypothetical protein
MFIYLFPALKRKGKRSKKKQIQNQAKGRGKSGVTN